MTDLIVAAVLLVFMVGLGVAAPIWGADSRDGIDSDQPARRAAWLHDRANSQPTRAASVALAGALRMAAYFLDAEAVAPKPSESCLAQAF